MTNSEALKREDAPIESTWNREDVYASWDIWQADYDTALAELPKLSEFSGKLGSSPAMLVDWLTTYSTHWRKVMKLSMFTEMAAVVDVGDLDAKEYSGKAMALQAKLNALTAFAEPELTEVGDKLLAWAEEEPRLAEYKHYFDNLLRVKPHQRSAEIEEMLSMLAEPFAGVAATARELTNLDLKFADAVDSQGGTHPVHQATVTPAGIQSPDREHRRSAWENYCDGYLSVQNTLASNYTTSVKQYVFLARVRGYDSVLEMMLSPSNLPLKVFHNVIDTFKENLSVWQRYWDVRRKVLKVDTLHPYDIWAPVVENSPTIQYQQAVEWIADALAPLGSSYVDVLRRGCLEERWVDYAPNAGKMQGAASSLRIDMPPFIFMSYDDSLMAVSVLAHELGHSMHSYFTDENQPQVYNNFSSISMAVAETTSNFNQAMLRAYLNDTKKDDRLLRIALLDEGISNFHRYFFVMPTLARFELEVFSRAEKNEPLTAPILNEIMRDLYAEGYGETMTDDAARTAITWAQFGHLYFPFYTFQYAVGIGAAHALADGVLAGQQDAVQNYMKLLRAGGALYPADVFKLAGVDMDSPEPIEKAFGVLSRMIDQMEELAA